MSLLRFSLFLGIVILFELPALASDNQKLVYVHCLSQHSESPRVLFDGFLHAESVTFNASTVSVTGRQRITRQTEVPDARCANTFLDQVCDSESCYYVSKSRNWNALEVGLKRSITMLNCSTTSLVEIFDDIDAWTDDLRTRLVGSPNNVYEGQVSDSSCFSIGSDLGNL